MEAELIGRVGDVSGSCKVHYGNYVAQRSSALLIQLKFGSGNSVSKLFGML
jgi:hypothetical protein